MIAVFIFCKEREKMPKNLTEIQQQVGLDAAGIYIQAAIQEGLSPAELRYFLLGVGNRGRSLLSEMATGSPEGGEVLGIIAQALTDEELEQED